MKTIMPEQDAHERNKNFNEVNLGYEKEAALKESLRCLQCNKPKCVLGCPVNIDIPGFIKEIKEEKFDKAANVIKKTNNLPGICGRVCPQETQCEERCIVGIKGDAIKIGHLERFAADNEKEEDIEKVPSNGKKVAVVGSGPAGLTCAADLAVLGYDVTIFEAFHETGGVLTYGIPEFRMPKRIVQQEVENIKKLGVSIKTNVIIGKTKSVQELLDSFDAIFIGTGAGLPYFMGIDGENLINVYSANEFLTRVNLMRAYDESYDTPVKKVGRVMVIGGGNVAMDSARVAKRLGADVTILYRRTKKEMPARDEEIKHAEEEGIKFDFLAAPVKIIGDKKVSGIKCIKMQLGEEDESGRKRPVPIPDSEFIIPVDQVIVAIGQGPNPLILKDYNLESGNKGEIIVNSKMQTSNPKIFAAGDIISGSSTVIAAMGDAKKAAKGIDEWLRKSLNQADLSQS